MTCHFKNVCNVPLGLAHFKRTAGLEIDDEKPTRWVGYKEKTIWKPTVQRACPLWRGNLSFLHSGARQGRPARRHLYCNSSLNLRAGRLWPAPPIRAHRPPSADGGVGYPKSQQVSLHVVARSEAKPNDAAISYLLCPFRSRSPANGWVFRAQCENKQVAEIWCGTETLRTKTNAVRESMRRKSCCNHLRRVTTNSLNDW